MFNQLHLFGQIQASQTSGQPYSDTSPFGECSTDLGLGKWDRIPTYTQPGSSLLEGDEVSYGAKR